MSSNNEVTLILSQLILAQFANQQFEQRSFRRSANFISRLSGDDGLCGRELALSFKAHKKF